MKLNEGLLKENSAGTTLFPPASVLGLPEKVVQFGTGVLLRGLPDYFIDKANRKGLFNGRVIMVKSTDNGDTSAFEAQDNLYTLCVKGIDEGKVVEEYWVNASISRVISARSQWDELLQAAGNPEMKLVISNTTEVGITLVEDNIHDHPPVSFPGKLLAFLYRRFKIFHGDPTKGLVVVPTELIPDNGSKLESILIELAHQNRLEAAFIDWLEQANDFCNSLVDRIVPGKLPAAEHQSVQEKLGYADDLMIMSEVYRLWVIETKNDRVREALSFAAADEGVILTPDIHLYRELKVRLLNAPHTFACGLAVLTGCGSVKEAMDDARLSFFISKLMIEEIAPAISGGMLTNEMAVRFAEKVLDRFRNPHIDHRWISITMNYSSKMKMRTIAAIQKHYEKNNSVPEAMALGFAAFLLFMKSAKGADGKYYGKVAGNEYLIQDDNAQHYAQLWETHEPAALVRTVLQDIAAWDADLSRLPGFEAAIGRYLDLLMKGEAARALELILNRPAAHIAMA